MTVVDASVAVKWLWPEPGEAEARQILDGGTKLFAPALIRIEVAGAILRRYRQKSITEGEAHSACGLWGRIIGGGILQLIPNDELFDTALALAFLTQHALADCLYVAAGKELDLPVLTADQILHQRCNRFGKIELLGGHTSH